jgi:hypothetical protein
MRRFAVLLAVAFVAGACGQKKEKAGDAPAASQQDLVSVTGVVSGVKEKSLQVRTDDGRTLDFAMDDAVTVTLGGGESQPAVVTEGAPVRVSFKPKGSDPELVSIDVEPQAPESKGEAPVDTSDVPADPSRAARSEAGAQGAAPAEPRRGGGAR